MTFYDALHLLGMDVTFGAPIPFEEMASPLFVVYTYTCDFFRGCFNVLVLYFHFGGIFGDQTKTYPPSIMDLHVLGSS
jgi:hypothetical protein